MRNAPRESRQVRTERQRAPGIARQQRDPYARRTPWPQQEVGGDIEKVGEEGVRGRVRQQREERQQQRGLVVNATVIGRNIVIVEEKTLKYCTDLWLVMNGVT